MEACRRGIIIVLFAVSLLASTAGGDCPGINAVIRAVTKTAINDYNMEVVGIADGYLGLIEGRWHDLPYESVSGILTQGGTILGTSNKANPFKYPVDLGDGKTGFKDVSDETIANFEKTGASVLVAIGGDGTLNISPLLSEKGVKTTWFVPGSSPGGGRS